MRKQNLDELIGKKFHNLTVLDVHDGSGYPDKYHRATVRCVCGNVYQVRVNLLKNMMVKQCKPCSAKKRIKLFAVDPRTGKKKPFIELAKEYDGVTYNMLYRWLRENKDITENLRLVDKGEYNFHNAHRGDWSNL